MKLYGIALIMAFLVLVSCDKEPNSIDTKNLDITTGIVLYDEVGYILTEYGNSSDKKVSDTKEESTAFFYPNPCTNKVSVYADEMINSIWIVRASPVMASENVDTEFTLDLELLSKLQVYQSHNIESTYGSIGISNLNSGFYKVYLQT